jgi:hypothetical protein
MAGNRTTLETPSFRMRSLRLRDMVYQDPSHGESWSRRRTPDGNRLRIDTAKSPVPSSRVSSQPHQAKLTAGHHTPPAIGQWRNGAPSGVWTFFDAAGNKDCEGRFDQGRRVGLWLYWYANGAIDSMGEYASDLEEGPWISFHSTGMIEEEGRFRAGQKVGIWTYVSRYGTRSVRDHGRQ